MENTVTTPQNEVNLEEQVKALDIEDAPTTPTNNSKPGKQETQGKHRQRGSRGGSGKKKENNNTNNNQSQTDYNPTALVVKNIHLGIDRDTFLQAMEELGLPKPFAFNYYYEEGAFRGLAFLNYRTPQDAQTVLTKLNGTELSGRRLKVEFKKYAPNSDKNFKPNSNVGGKENNKERDSKDKDNGNNSNVKANFNLNLSDAILRKVFTQVSQFQANFQQQECFFPNDPEIQPELLEIMAHKLNLYYSIDPELNCVKLSKVESQKSPLAKFSRQNQLAEEIRSKKGGSNQQEKRGSRDSNNERKREKGNQTGGNNNNNGNNNNGGNGGNNVNPDNSGVESPRGNERRNKNRNSRLESPSTPNRENLSGRSPRNSQLFNSSNNTPDPQSPANIQTPPSTSASSLQPRDLEKSASSQSREAPFLIRNKVSPQAFTIMPVRQPKGPDLTQNFHSRKFGLNTLYAQGGNMQHPATPPAYI